MKMKALALALLLAGQAWAHGVSGIDTANFNSSVRPQDDIYRAVNGKWQDTHEIPASESWSGAFKELRDLSEARGRELIEQASANPSAGGNAQKIGALYASFMDEAAAEKKGLQPIEADLQAVTMLAGRNELLKLIGSWQSGNVQLPLGLFVGIDARNATAYLPELYQSGLIMPDRDYYLGKDARFAKARGAYQAYLGKLFRLAGYAQPEKRAQRVIALETKLAKLQRSRVENRDPQKTYNKMTPAQLAKLAPKLDWQGFLSAAGVAGIPELNVSQPEYVAGLAQLLRKEPLLNWQDYLIAHALDGYAPYLNKAVVDARFEFHGKTLSGTPEQRPRWKRGVQLVESSLGEALGQLYVAKYFPPENKRKMEELVGNLMQAYRQSIDGLSWMSPATKEAAQVKLSKYMLKIGYPDHWRDYSGLELKADDLVGNVKRANRFDYQWQLSHLGKPVDRTEWGMTPQTVNAYYNPSQNEIVFPAAILQPPFFNAAADDAANYGGIGAVIGHEISHGFDDQGSQFDADGNLRDWWTAEDKARFHGLTSKLVAQYDAYEPLPGKHINGKLTLGENIADNVGLQIAYKAYQLSLGGKPAPVIDGMNGDQRFFYGFAQVWRSKTRDEALLARLVSDPHSPDAFRAIGAASNSDAFQRAFDVKPGDRMYKPDDQRIRIW
ncbi:peptidase M13 [Chromobacterium violaceum]|uniref:M13 family metallopeptidase n=1 Tax=Chromobacterium violaceum TaxID=536 RepID=UPI000C126CA6|nr:M13 family metallopeptidase [Chromobacterium violaceum]ATP28567.1 peptidase M13 [Chromobacterium violaceum]ATP32477.1 peptidase M13 [Chromobacterium violaceum]